MMSTDYTNDVMVLSYNLQVKAATSSNIEYDTLAVILEEVQDRELTVFEGIMMINHEMGDHGNTD